MMIKKVHIIVKIGVGSLLFCLLYCWLLPHYDVSNADKNLFSLDLLSSYSTNDVNHLFNTIGNKGVDQYHKFLIVDTVYIFIYSFLTINILAYLQKHMGRLGNLTLRIRWFPVVVGLLDLIENLNTFSLLKHFPEINDNWVNFGSSITTLKWLSVYVLAGIIICFGIFVCLRYLFWKFKSYNSLT